MTELQQNGNTSSEMEETVMCFQYLQQKATSMYYLEPLVWYVYKMELGFSSNITDCAHCHLLCAPFWIHNPHLLTY
jgi:hypothetical protein